MKNSVTERVGVYFLRKALLNLSKGTELMATNPTHSAKYHYGLLHEKLADIYFKITLVFVHATDKKTKDN